MEKLFLSCLYNKLRYENNENAVYIDISHYQEIDDIFNLIVNIILFELDGEEKIKEFSRFSVNKINAIMELLPNEFMIKQIYDLSKKLFELNNIDKDYNIYKRYNKRKTRVDNFLKKYRDLLERFNSEEERYIIIIDNLEKCSPEFVIKFFLYTQKLIYKNILFIFSYDKAEIANALKSFYGENFNVQNFFRKFVFKEYRITKYYNNIDRLIESVVINGFGNLGFSRNDLIQKLSDIYRDSNLSLRILILLVDKLNLFDRIVKQEQNHNKEDGVKPYFYILFITLYKFLCEWGYDKVFLFLQREELSEIEELYDILDNDQRKKFDNLKDLVSRIVNNAEINIEDLKYYLSLIELI